MHIILHVLFVLSLISSAFCGSFDNTDVEIVPKTGAPFTVKLTGAVERKSLDSSVQAVGVKVKNQPLPRLKLGTVQNLIKLKTVEFVNTSTEVVEVGTFRHLPNLEKIFITDSAIRVIASGVFHELPALHKIRVSNNKISVIEDGAFANIPTLQLLYVGGNDLQVWNPKWFTNSTALKELEFKYNLLRKLPRHAFPNLGKLTKIFLDYNDISEIESDAFRDVKHLKYLGLTYNRLTALEPNVFPEQMSIETFYIESNKLNFISNGLLDRVAVKKIALDGNPLICPCSDRFVFRLHQGNGTVLTSQRCKDDHIPVCVFGDVYTNTCLDIVDENATKVYFGQVKDALKTLDASKFSRCFRFD